MVRSLLRILGILRRKPEGDEQHEPLLPYTQRSGCSEDDRAQGDMLLHGTHSRAKRAWLFFDALGNPTLKEVEKHSLVTRLGIPWRDLRILDPSIPSPSPAAIFIREQAIVFNVESLRMIITKDEVILLSVPVGVGKPLSKWMPPSLVSPFVREMSIVLRPMDRTAALPRVPSFRDHILPFELRAVETALSAAVQSWEAETLALEHRILPTLRALLQKMSREELSKLRHCKATSRKMLGRLNAFKRALEDILDDQEDMANMYLGRKTRVRARGARSDGVGSAKTSVPHDDEMPPPAAHESNAIPKAQTNTAESTRMRGPVSASDRCLSAPPGPMDTVAAKAVAAQLARQQQTPPIGEEGAVQAAREEPEGGTMQSAPSAPATQFPSQEGPDKGEGPLRGKTLWSRHVRRMSLAHALIRHLRGEPGGDGEEDEEEGLADISACENLLESYFAQVDFLVNRLSALDEHMRSAEDQLALELDHRRNELVALDLCLAAVSTVFTFASMIAGIFGMNSPLPAWFQKSTNAFPLICLWTAMIGFVMFIGFVVYARWKRLLFIPDAAALTRDTS